MSTLIASTPFPAFAEEIVDTPSPLCNAITSAYRRDEAGAGRNAFVNAVYFYAY